MMIERRKDYCNACRFWFHQVARAGMGECRRYPPAHAYLPQGGSGRVSPVTGAYFWCGEHSPSGEVVATPQDGFADDHFSEATP
jgi:hypothetical protein